MVTCSSPSRSLPRSSAVFCPRVTSTDASDAAEAMELGCDGVLMNSAIANAENPILMASAMKHAIISGRESYLAGRMIKKSYASASSPMENLI